MYHVLCVSKYFAFALALRPSTLCLGVGITKTIRRSPSRHFRLESDSINGVQDSLKKQAYICIVPVAGLPTAAVER